MNSKKIALGWISLALSCVFWGCKKEKSNFSSLHLCVPKQIMMGHVEKVDLYSFQGGKAYYFWTIPTDLDDFALD